MSIAKDEDQVFTEQASDVQTAPAAGDLLVLQGDHEFQLSELGLEADESNTFEVIVRDQGGGNPRTVSTYNSSSIDDGSFDSPVAEAGAGREIAIVIDNAGSADNDYRTNYRVDRRRS